MRLTDQDKELFRILGNSETGKVLAEYCERLVDSAYDSRNWKDGDTKETADMASRLIKEFLVDKIKIQTQPKVVNPNNYI